MPYSFTKIEEDKGKVISLVFAALILFYFISAWCIYFCVKNFLFYQMHRYQDVSGFTGVGIKESLIIFGAAFVAGFGHWSATIHNLIPKMIGRLGAEPVSPADTYHQMFRNVIEEVSVATGGRTIEGVVVPAMAMNAFALADFRGRAVIGVTEGLLSRLSRAQLEAVVGHEAAHIVSGDCLVATVASSLFELYSDLLNGMKRAFSGSRSSYSGYGRYRGSGSGVALVLLIYGLLSVTTTMGKLMRMFVSRQRELRADAVAVRLTRDPLSLAEALYTISHRWRGAGLSGDELEAIFIINPRFNRLDEGTGLFSDLFSTHPPVEKRLALLLSMAHADVKNLEATFLKRSTRPKQLAPEHSIRQEPIRVDAGSTEWIVHNEGEWQGPFSFKDITTLGWLRPDTWIKRMGGEHISRAFEDTELKKTFQKNENAAIDMQCPRCHVALHQEHYEGLCVFRCSHCHGVLMQERDAQRVVIREDYCFSDRIATIGKRIKEAQKKFGPQKINLKTAILLTCPKCNNKNVKMIRMFYTDVYHVEIDKCIFCGYVWFDKDELEVLQYLIEEGVGESCNF